MIKKLMLCLLLNYTLSLSAQVSPLPVIDMHLHALHAVDQGPPPIYIGAPFRDLGIHDPANDFRKTFMTALKKNSWADKFIASPTTDDSLKVMTLDVLKRNNVYAVTSGDIATVRQWQRAAPDR